MDWRDIPGYEGRYQASDDGQIRSLDRRVWSERPWGGRWECRRGRVLRPGPSNSGHLSVVLGKGNTQSVHVLVLLTFVGPCPPGQEVLHLNSIPWHNALTNLRYGTRSENMKMDYALGVRTVPAAWVYSSNGQRKKSYEEYA